MRRVAGRRIKSRRPHLFAQRLAKILQAAQTIIAAQHERMVVITPPEASCPFEPYRKRRVSKVRAHMPGALDRLVLQISWAVNRRQSAVQPIPRDHTAFQSSLDTVVTSTAV